MPEMRDRFDDYVFDSWIVTPAYATGSTMDGTRRYAWEAVHVRAARWSAVNGLVFATEEAARAAADEMTKNNQAF